MALVGDLKDLNIATIIQLNCVERNTAELMISARRGAARVYFDKGEIVISKRQYRGDVGTLKMSQKGRRKIKRLPLRPEVAEEQVRAVPLPVEMEDVPRTIGMSDL